jgi:hypothetical protein
MKAVTPSMVVYMAKLEGRYAADAWNMPVLVTVMIKKMMAILGLRARETTENSLVSQTAHTNARTIRRK